MDPTYTAMLARVREKSAARGLQAPVKQGEPLDGINCSRCGGSGYVEVTEADGHVYMAHCPSCYSKRMVVRHLRASGVNPIDYNRYTLTKFDGSRSPEASKMLAMAMRYLNSYDKETSPGLGLFGMSGMGKSHLCIAICQAITKKFGEPHYYFPYRSVMPDLVKAAKGYSYDYDAAMEKWRTLPNVYFDDLFKMAGEIQNGHLVRLDRDEEKIMFDIINARYINHLRTFFSSEYSIHDITVIDSALGSRIVEMIKPYGLYVEGKNQRLVG